MLAEFYGLYPHLLEQPRLRPGRTKGRTHEPPFPCPAVHGRQSGCPADGRTRPCTRPAPPPAARRPSRGFLGQPPRRHPRRPRTGCRRTGPEACLPELLAFARRKTAPRLRNVINSTGVVIIPTWDVPCWPGVPRRPCAGSSRLRPGLDLHSGGRSSRYVIIDGELLQRLTGAEAAMVVNNNAAAVTNGAGYTLPKGGEVVVSRAGNWWRSAAASASRSDGKSSARLRRSGRHQPPCHLHDYAGYQQGIPAPSCAYTPQLPHRASIPPCPARSGSPGPGTRPACHRGSGQRFLHGLFFRGPAQRTYSARSEWPEAPTW